MNQRPPGSQRTYTPFPYTTPFRSSDAKAPIAALLRDGFPATEPIVADDVRIDDAIRPIELHHVVDADSSQTVVIAEAAGGRSLVVKGPPGTGKSQTITNIIAAAVARGKKVDRKSTRLNSSH